MLNELQAAIYSRVSSISSLGADVYGYIPQDTVDYPFVMVDPVVIEDNSDDSNINAYGGSVSIHTFTSEKSTLNIAAVQKKIYDSLHLASDLTVTGHLVSIIRQVKSEIYTESDGITHHGVQRFDFLLEVPENYTY